MAEDEPSSGIEPEPGPERYANSFDFIDGDFEELVETADTADLTVIFEALDCLMNRVKPESLPRIMRTPFQEEISLYEALRNNPKKALEDIKGFSWDETA